MMSNDGINLVGRILSQAGLKICLQVGDPEEAGYLAEIFKAPSLQFDLHKNIQVLPDGFDWARTVAVSVSRQTGDSTSTSLSVGETHTQSFQESTGRTIQEAFSLALSRTETEGESASASVGKGRSRSRGKNWTKGKAASLQASSSKVLTQSGSETHTESNGVTSNISKALAVGRTHSDSQTSGTAAAENHSVTTHAAPGGTGLVPSRNVSSGDALTKNTSAGSVDAVSETETTARGRGVNSSESDGQTSGWAVAQGETQGAGVTLSAGEGGSEGESESDTLTLTQGTNNSTSNGITAGASRSSALSQTQSSGRSDGTTLTQTDGKTHSEAQGVSVTVSKTPLARHRFIEVSSGHLEMATTDQIGQVKTEILSRRDREALVLVKGMPDAFLVRTHDLKDAYVLKKRVATGAQKAKEMDGYLQRVWAAHDCYFQLPEDEDDMAGIERFLGVASADVDDTCPM